MRISRNSRIYTVQWVPLPLRRGIGTGPRSGSHLQCFLAPKSLHPKQDLDPFNRLHSCDTRLTCTYHATGTPVAIARISWMRCCLEATYCSLLQFFVALCFQKTSIMGSNNLETRHSVISWTATTWGQLLPVIAHVVRLSVALARGYLRN